MAAPPQGLDNNDIVEVRYVQDCYDQRLLNVLHYKFLTGGPPADFVLTMNSFDVFLKSTQGVLRRIHLMQESGCVNVRIDYQIIRPARFVVYTTLGMGAGEGGTPDVASIPNTAVVITKRGTKAKKGGTGSIHIGGIEPGQLQQGSVGAATLVKMAQVVLSVPLDFKPVATDTLRPIILNRTAPAQSQEVASATGQFTSRIMRRRTRGVGV